MGTSNSTIKDFNPAKSWIKKLIRKDRRFTQLALIAAQEALQNAGWENPDALHETYASHRIGVSIRLHLWGSSIF